MAASSYVPLSRPKPRQLDLDCPVWGSANGKVTHVITARITALPRTPVSVAATDLHFCNGHSHCRILRKRADTRLVEARRIPVASRLRSAMINNLHCTCEVTNNPVKVRGPARQLLAGVVHAVATHVVVYDVSDTVSNLT